MTALKGSRQDPPRRQLEASLSPAPGDHNGSSINGVRTRGLALPGEERGAGPYLLGAETPGILPQSQGLPDGKESSGN